MSPKERIYTIRLLERFSEHSEFFDQIGVSIEFRNDTVGTVNDHTKD